jgi:hypothetical protein
MITLDKKKINIKWKDELKRESEGFNIKESSKNSNKIKSIMMKIKRI